MIVVRGRVGTDSNSILRNWLTTELLLWGSVSGAVKLVGCDDSERTDNGNAVTSMTDTIVDLMLMAPLALSMLIVDCCMLQACQTGWVGH